MSIYGNERHETEKNKKQPSSISQQTTPTNILAFLKTLLRNTTT